MGNYKQSSFVFFSAVTILLILASFSGASGPTGSSSETKENWGLRTTTVNTPSGKLTINMPDDAALGDTISGTVIAEPAGETVAEKKANMDTLEGYVVDIEEVPDKTVASVPEEAPGGEPEGKKINTWVIPPTIATEIVSLVLKDPKGKEVAKTEFPVTGYPEYTPPGVPGPEDYNLPTIGQAGRPVELTGPFDGEVVNTEVTIGGKDADVLAQSPRKTVAESPSDIVGPTEIKLKDGDVTVKEPYRNVALKLSADKLTLMRGEQTNLRVQVLGLQGLEEEIPFSLVNKSPEVVSMEGGDSQTVTITPQDVGPEGDYTIRRTLTGRQTGPFSISARISPEYMTVPLPPTVAFKDDECECKHMKLELGKKDKTVRYQEKLKNGDTKITLKVPYRFNTKCVGDKGAKCVAEAKVEALRVNWKGPEPSSEEVHSGGAAKVTHFTKPPRGADKNIDCSLNCPRRIKQDNWESGFLYYEALFKKLDKKLGGAANDRLKITLTPEKCRGRDVNKLYNMYGCECNKITLVFEGLKKSRGEYYVEVGGRFSGGKPGVVLNIPYKYKTQCTGHNIAKCNAQVEVNGKPANWTVRNVVRKGGGHEITKEDIKADKVKINQGLIECTGKCNEKGDPAKKYSNKMHLMMKIDVPVGEIGKDNIDRYTGDFELAFTPKYCGQVEINDKVGRVVDKITFKADVKSEDWEDIVGD